jgi:hypothetical protein
VALTKEDLMNKLYEQPFTVILLVCLLVWQNKAHEAYTERIHLKETQNHAEYEAMIQEDRDLMLQRNERLVEAIKKANSEKTEEIKSLYERLVKCADGL